MKNRAFKIIISVLTMIGSTLSSAIGYGFMGGTNLRFSMKFVCGIILIGTPILMVQLLILLWKKEK